MSVSGTGWDDQLFAGTAEYYERGRLPYADRLVSVLADELRLDGRGTLVDVGSGPGTLAIPLAPLFRKVLAVEPDPEMAAIGRAKADAAGVDNIEWQGAPAEQLSLAPRSVDVALFGQSFHWMDRSAVAVAMRTALRRGGYFVLISDVKGQPGTVPGSPEVPQQAIDALVTEYLGAGRRAGRRVLSNGTPNDEEEVLADAGYDGPRRVVVENPRNVVRSVPDLLAGVFSRSDSAPHLFGDRYDEFAGRLTSLLAASAVDGGYLVTLPATDVRIWAVDGSGVHRSPDAQAPGKAAHLDGW